jgi:hypothetical protein
LPSEPNSRLKQLKEWLIEIPKTAFEYAQYLRDLEIQKATIETNNKNYSTCLNQLQDTSIQGEDNLEFLQQFINHAQDKLVRQINVDLSYLMPSQQLFGQMIKAIRGIVETEQAESDRNLQNTIAMVGVGLAAAAVGATVAPYIIAPAPQTPILLPLSTNHLHPLTQALLLSLVFGATGAVVTKGFITITGRLTQLIRGGSNKTAKLPGSTQQHLPQSQK